MCACICDCVNLNGVCACSRVFACVFVCCMCQLRTLADACLRVSSCKCAAGKE